MLDRFCYQAWPELTTVAMYHSFHWQTWPEIRAQSQLITVCFHPDQSWQNSGNQSQFASYLTRADRTVAIDHSLLPPWPELTEQWQLITVCFHPDQSWQTSGNQSQFASYQTRTDRTMAIDHSYASTLTRADRTFAICHSLLPTWPELTEQWQLITVCFHPDPIWQNSGNRSQFASTLTRADRTVAISHSLLPTWPELTEQWQSVTVFTTRPGQRWQGGGSSWQGGGSSWQGVGKGWWCCDSVVWCPCCVCRFVETEKHRNAARPVLQSLEKTRSIITALLKKQFSSQPGNMRMAKELCVLWISGGIVLCAVDFRWSCCFEKYIQIKSWWLPGD